MSNVDKIHEYMLGMYTMYSWITIGLMFMVMVIMLVIVSPQVDGFITQNTDNLLAQRQQLQFEGESRYNNLGRVENPNSNPSATGIDDAVRLLVPKATDKTSNQMMNVASSGNLKASPNNPNISLEETGNVQAKINFCESLTSVTCDFNDPRMAECGFCHSKGVNSKGVTWRGGMYISADDQIRANQVATAANPTGNMFGVRAKYVPTVGTCEPKNFTLTKANCDIRENQLICEKTSDLDGTPCAQCYGSTGSLIYVGPKPRSYQAYLNVSHPGGHNNNGISIQITNTTATTRALTLASSSKPILDSKQIPITVTEGDTIKISMLGIPSVWCAWLSSPDGKRGVGISIGEQDISPPNAIGIIGDKRSLRVSSAFKKEQGFAAFQSTVPNSVMWYGRNRGPGLIVSAWYGLDKQNGVSVITAVRNQAGMGQPIKVLPANLGVADPYPDIQKYLWITMDNGTEYVGVDDDELAASLFNNNVTITFKVPATLVEPTYPDDLEACPTGPLIATGVGAGLFGSNSCYNTDGTFNPSIFCLQELFEGAGGNNRGSMWPYYSDSTNKIISESAKAIIQSVNGVPDLNATASFLDNLGSIATYGTDSNGASVPFATYVDASMKMLGTKPKNMCEGPNAQTGPQTPECLDYLWRTNGNTSAPASSDYLFCGKNGKLAPLNADRTPNMDNVAKANTLGSVAAIGAYYSRLYNSAQDTSNFDTWSAAMKKCYNTSVTAPKVDCPLPPPPPYDNGKVYRTGDKITFNGGRYHLSAYIGGAGYSPSHPSSEGKKWIEDSPPYDAKTLMCITAVEETGFIPRDTWGTTPPANQQAICDDLLCPYFKNKYGSLNNVPSKYFLEVEYCKSRGLGI